MKRIQYKSLKRLLTICFLLLTGSTLHAQQKEVAGSGFVELKPTDYPVNEAELPFFHTQEELGRSYGNQYSVKIEFPEFTPLTAQEAKLAGRHLAEITDGLPEVETHLSTSRGEAWLEYRFTPIVKRNGKLMRMTSCKISIQQNISPANYRTLAQAANTKKERYADHSVLATGNWVKIRVKTEGIYQLTHEQLAQMGFSNPDKVKLYGYGGLIQNEYLEFEGNNKVIDDLQEVPLFRRNGSMLFFAEGTVRWTWNAGLLKWTHQQNPYSNFSYYFLTEGESPLEFGKLPACESDGQAPIENISHYAVLDEDRFSWYKGGREFYDEYDFRLGNSHTFKLAAKEAVAGENCLADIAFSVSSATSSARTDVELNGKDLGFFSTPSIGSKEDARETRITFRTQNLAGENSFKFTTTSGVSARLNYIRLNYTRRLSAKDAPFSFIPKANSKENQITLKINNASTSTRLWRLGIADSPIAEVPAALEGNFLTATTDSPTRRFVIADIAANYPSPEVVGKVENQDLHAHTAQDMIIIVPTSGKLTEEAERLAAFHRERQGLRIKIVKAGDIYNEFSSGTPDATAYRRYVKMLYDRAESEQDMPRYLLFFGDCLWDNRMVTDEAKKGLTPDDYLLSYERNSSESSIGTITCYVTDDYFGLLEDGKGKNITTEKVDIGIGRFTCSTPEEAKIYVNKSIAYIENKNVGAWKNTFYVLGDDRDNNEHMEDAEGIVSEINKVSNENMSIKRVYWDAYARTMTPTGASYPQVRKQLLEDMRKGSALVYNYSGHGSPDQISHSKILFTEDFAQPTGNMSLWVFASCEITPFDTPADNIGRTAMLNPDGGAIAVMCASRAVYATENNHLNKAFCQHLFGKDIDNRPNTLGDAMRKAKAAMLALNQDKTMNKLKYLLIGDPALRLSYPTHQVVFDSINGEALTAGTLKQLKAGSVARFSGHIAAPTGTMDATFNGILTASIADKLETIVCKKNDSQTDEPMTYTDRPHIIYEGNDSVRAGKFTLSVLIPKDISYTNDCGRITAYAVNTDRSIEANGHNTQFFLNGTDANSEGDTVQPKVFVYLNTPDFPNGGFTNSTPVFMADISDDCGINATGTNIGHDMELVIDGKLSEIYTLNDYFNYDFGSYRSGRVSYPMEALSPGKHSLSFRVWDVNNNSTTSTLDFIVSNSQSKAFDVNATQNPARTTTSFITSFTGNEEAHTVVTEVYDIAGRRIWIDKQTAAAGVGYTSSEWKLTDNSGTPVPAGIYLYRSTATSSGKSKESEAKKIIVIRQ